MAIKKTTILKGKNKATQKTIDIILKAISEGLTQRDASKLAGISEDTLSLWKKDSDFSEQMRQKEIEYKLSLIRTINKEATTNWKAGAWILEHKYRDEYATNTNNKIDLETTERLQELGNIIRGILTPKKTI